MAPIIDHQAAVTANHTVARSPSAAAAHLTIKREDEEHENDGQELGSSITVLAKDDFAQHDVDDDTRDEYENVHAAKSIFRIGDNINNASSSLFMDECDNYNNDSVIFTEDTITADLKHSALMTSFDTMEDIDLRSVLSMTSPSNKDTDPLQQEFQHSISTTTADSSNAAILFSTDEELARQLQAEEDEYAQQQRDIFRQKAKQPPRKLKKSWLDNLIGEPFPSEVRRNYAKKSSSKSHKGGKSSGLMKAIAAAEARASAAIDSSSSSVLVDKTNTTTTFSKRGSNASSSSINVDEGINQLSTSISKWWSNNVVTSPNSEDAVIDSPTTTSEEEEEEEELPIFIDNGSEGYYTGDFLTDPTNNNNNNTPQQPLQRHGQGIMTYKSGHTFTGNFQNNTFHGWGIYLWADGDKQRGTWKHGLRHGPCVFHHAASDTIEYGYYDQGNVVGEGVRVNGDRTKAWKLVDGKRVLDDGGIIEMVEAERIVAERFECFPIPVAVMRKDRRVDDGIDEEER